MTHNSEPRLAPLTHNSESFAKPKKALDKGRGRGRKPKASPDEFRARATHFKMVMERVKDQVDWNVLRTAKTREAVERALREVDTYYRDRFLDKREAEILKILGDKRCPKDGEGSAFHKFLAVALAGSEYHLSPRRSLVIMSKSRQQAPAASVPCHDRLEAEVPFIVVKIKE